MRYFFRLSAEKGASDGEGIELASLAAAKSEAFRYLADTLRDYAEVLPDEDELKLTVSNAGGVTLLAFTLFLTAPMPMVSAHAAKRSLATA